MKDLTKYRTLFLYQILLKNTDQDHKLTTNELIKLLHDEHGIDVNRNTIGNDIKVMKDSGIQIEIERSTQNRYYYDGWDFDAAELKTLVDVVSSAQFITEKQSKLLIEKLLKLTTVDKANKINRHVYASERVKSDNEKGYYIVDGINEAIESGKKISFHYTEYDINKNRIDKNDGEPYTVSPYAMIWDGDYYYLRGFCDERNEIRNFRLDRFRKEPDILDEKAVVKPEDFDMGEFSKEVFRMYDTQKTEKVTFLCKASAMNAFIDKFGTDVKTVPVDEDHFAAEISVCLSPTFYRWVFGFGTSISIQAPMHAVAEYKKMLLEEIATLPEYNK